MGAHNLNTTLVLGQDGWNNFGNANSWINFALIALGVLAIIISIALFIKTKKENAGQTKTKIAFPIALAVIGIIVIVASFTVNTASESTSIQTSSIQSQNTSIVYDTQIGANVDSEGHIEIQETTLKNTGTMALQIQSIGWASNNDQISGEWTAKLDNTVLFSGKPDESAACGAIIKSGQSVKIQWSTTFAGQQAINLIGKTAGVACYTIKPIQADHPEASSRETYEGPTVDNDGDYYFELKSFNPLYWIFK